MLLENKQTGVDGAKRVVHPEQDNDERWRQEGCLKVSADTLVRGLSACTDLQR
jgi:hypothetical protein